MFGRKKKNEEAATKSAAPEKQSQLSVLKDAFKLVKGNSPLAIVWCLLVFLSLIHI